MVSTNVLCKLGVVEALLCWIAASLLLYALL